MAEMVREWAQMWGARVKMPTDMRDDMLRDAIDTSRDALSLCSDFDAEGLSDTQTPQFLTSSRRKMACRQVYCACLVCLRARGAYFTDVFAGGVQSIILRLLFQYIHSFSPSIAAVRLVFMGE